MGLWMQKGTYFALRHDMHHQKSLVDSSQSININAIILQVAVKIRHKAGGDLLCIGGIRSHAPGFLQRSKAHFLRQLWLNQNS